MAVKRNNNLPHTSSNAAQEARRQAEEYNAIVADTDLELCDGTVLKIPPHPDLGFLDDDRLGEYEELLVEVEGYDREPDIFIPEQKLLDPNTGKETGVVLPAETRPGALKRPFRKDQQLIKPPHSVRVVITALGEENYKLLRAGGKSAADVWRIWGRQGLLIQERAAFRSSIPGGPVALETVSAADS